MYRRTEHRVGLLQIVEHCKNSTKLLNQRHSDPFSYVYANVQTRAHSVKKTKQFKTMIIVVVAVNSNSFNVVMVIVTLILTSGLKDDFVFL